MAAWDNDPVIGTAKPWELDPVVGHAKPPEPPAPTWKDRVQAHQAGVFNGLSYLAGAVPDAAANTVNLLRAGAGAAYDYLHAKPDQPEPARTSGGLYHYVDPQTGVETFSRNAPPAAAQAHYIPAKPDLAPSVDAGPSPVGAAIARTLDKNHDWTPTTPDRPDDLASRWIFGASSVIPSAAVGAPTVAGTMKSTAAALPAVTAGQAVSELHPFESDAANTLAAALTQAGVSAGAPALTKYAIRGASPAAYNAEANRFRQLGAEPTVGQASGNRAVQFVESGLGKIPGGAGVIEHAANEQAQAIGTGVGNLVTNLAEDTSPERAGRAIERGVTGEGGFRDRFNAKAGELYGNLDEHIAPSTPVKVNNTLGTLDAIAKPIPGAEATSAALVNPKVAAIRQALLADLGKDGGPTSLPYQALAGIRTQVGDLLSGSELVADVPRAQLKRLYGGISADLEQAARAQGPDAYAAYTRASNYYNAGMKRMDILADVVGKAGGPESVFNAALSGTKDGATKLRAVMQSLDDDQQRTVAGTVLKRMGSATPGNQNAAGDTFSPQTFLTNWNKMSPEAKRALFDRFGPDLRAQVDNVASVADNLRQGSKVFRNASGTSAGEAQVHALRDLILGVVAGGGAHHVAGATGLTAAAAVPATAYLGAKALTNPAIVDWVGKNVIGPSQAASLMSQPGVLSAQQRERLAAALQSQPE